MSDIVDVKDETTEPQQKSGLHKYTPAIAVSAVVLALVAVFSPAWLPALKNAVNKPVPKAAVTAPVKVSPTPVVPVTPAPVTPTEPTLALGSTGAAVTELQTRLNVWDVQPQLAVNGSFNAVTVAAVKAFQAAENLTADGVVGAHSWTALEAAPPAIPVAIPYFVPKPVPIIKIPVAAPADLSVAIQPAYGGATAGAMWYDLTFTNITKHAVTMDGFPTVAAGVSGIQVGAGAADVTSVAPVMTTIQPGDTAYALLKVTDVGAITPAPVTGATTQLLVEIPGSQTQLVIPLALTSAADGTSFLTIYPVSLNAGA